MSSSKEKKSRTQKPRSPGGLSVHVTTHEPEGMPPSSDVIAIVPIGERKKAYPCGHRSWARFTLDLYGQKHELTAKAIAVFEKCPECFLEEAKAVIIRCGLCGHSITPGESVALYANDGIFANKPWKRTAQGGSVIGCLRTACCPSGGFLAGTWDGEKLVSAFEGGTASEHVMKTGKPVLVTG